MRQTIPRGWYFFNPSLNLPRFSGGRGALAPIPINIRAKARETSAKAE